MHKNAAFKKGKIVINYRQKKTEGKVRDKIYGKMEEKIF